MKTKKNLVLANTKNWKTKAKTKGNFSGLQENFFYYSYWPYLY